MGLQLAVSVEDRPRETLAGVALRVQIGALDATPWPLTVKLSVPFAELLVTPMDPTRVPVAAGLKVTLIAQEAPAATRLPQVLPDTANTLTVGRMLVMLSLPPPVLVKVIILGALVVPTYCGSKVSASWLNETVVPVTRMSFCTDGAAL
jgi:hypothetical protein